MCLSIMQCEYALKDNSFYNTLKKQGWAWAYKKFMVSSYSDVLTYFYQCGDVNADKNGWIYSNRYTTKISSYEADRGEIDLGIHVYTDESNASSVTTKATFYKNNYAGTTVYLKVKVFMKDLISMGEYGQAVFTKIKFDPKDLKELGLKYKVMSSTLFNKCAKNYDAVISVLTKPTKKVVNSLALKYTLNKKFDEYDNEVNFTVTNLVIKDKVLAKVIDKNGLCSDIEYSYNEKRDDLTGKLKDYEQKIFNCFYALNGD